MNSKPLSLFLLLAFTLVFMMGVGSATQQPAGWWNITTNMSLSSSYNISDEINTTNSNLTLNTGSNLQIVNSNLTFSAGQLSSTSAQHDILNISNSRIIGLNNGSTNRILINRHTNLSIDNSIISGFSSFFTLQINLLNNFWTNIFYSELSNMSGSQIIDGSTSNKVNVSHSTLRNVVGDCTNFRSSNNTYFNNVTFNNCSNNAYYFKTNSQNMSIINSSISNVNYGTVIDDSNNSLIDNVLVINASGYAFDHFGYGNNHIIRNSRAINSSEGIIFSHGDNPLISTSNLTSSNNSIINITNHGYEFKQVNIAYSYNDYGENIGRDNSGETFGLVLWSNVSNANIINMTLKNVGWTSNSTEFRSGVYIENNVTNVSIDNITLINTTLDYYFAYGRVSINNITIKNSEVYNNEETILIGYSNATNISFINLGDRDFIINTASNKNITIGQNQISILRFNSTFNETINSQFEIYNLTNALIYNTNGTVYGSTTISSNDGNVNITLQPSNSSYVLDNFNLTEGTTRANSPIAFTQKQSDSVHITNSLTDTLDQVTVVLEIENCNNVGVVTFTSDSGVIQRVNQGDFTCNGDIATIVIDNVEPAMNSNILSWSYGCSAFERAGYEIIRIASALIILAGVTFYLYKKNDLSEITTGDLMMAFIAIVVCLGLFLGVVDNIAQTCPV